MAGSIKKGEGVTPAERYLKKLCDRTFLSLWSYPGIYRDQGAKNGMSGKELCDLLVVFENDIIIFSDKYCKYPDTRDRQLNWNRWFKRAVVESANQAWGAERWIKSFPNRIFLDKKCAQPFPYDLPNLKKARFHLVIVAHDVARKCAQELGGSGSLMIQSDLTGVTNHIIPFTIGDLDPNKSFVHILDDTSLRILMSARDTIFDFVDYLTKKEQFVRHGKPLFAAGEEELLAHFLKRVNEKEEHDFIFPPDSDRVALLEGHWEDFQKNPQRKAQLSADRISYSWDSLIETFSGHALNDSQSFSVPPGIKSTEKIMRFLAREPRVRRRLLGRALVDLVQKTAKDKQLTRYVLPSLPGDPYYVFLVFPMIAAKSYKKYREMRQGYLEMYCRIVKFRNPNALDIVGVATESGDENGGRSEDAIYYDARHWTKDDQQLAREILEQLKLPLKQPTPNYSREEEYPETAQEELEPAIAIPKNPRNKPCPCKSGKKFKKCHGK